MKEEEDEEEQNEHMCVDVTLGHSRTWKARGGAVDAKWREEHRQGPQSRQKYKTSQGRAEEPTSDTRTFSTTTGMGRMSPQMMEGTGPKNLQHKQTNSAQAHLSKQGSCKQVGLEAEAMRKGSKRERLHLRTQKSKAARHRQAKGLGSGRDNKRGTENVKTEEDT